MKQYQKLYRLPLGHIRASGWTGEQLRRNIEGMGGHLDELEPGMIATPYTMRETYEGWGRDLVPKLKDFGTFFACLTFFDDPDEHV